MCTPRLPVGDLTESPADLNGLVRFAERRNLVSARVPPRFKRSLPSLRSLSSTAFSVRPAVLGTDIGESHNPVLLELSRSVRLKSTVID